MGLLQLYLLKAYEERQRSSGKKKEIKKKDNIKVIYPYFDDDFLRMYENIHPELQSFHNKLIEINRDYRKRKSEELEKEAQSLIGNEEEYKAKIEESNRVLHWGSFPIPVDVLIEHALESGMITEEEMLKIVELLNDDELTIKMALANKSHSKDMLKEFYDKMIAPNTPATKVLNFSEKIENFDIQYRRKKSNELFEEAQLVRDNDQEYRAKVNESARAIYRIYYPISIEEILKHAVESEITTKEEITSIIELLKDENLSSQILSGKSKYRVDLLKEFYSKMVASTIPKEVEDNKEIEPSIN